MPFAIRTPRINNNDDVVRLSAIVAQPGAVVRVGDLIAEVATDKATFAVETDRPGYFLMCAYTVGDTIAVGSVLAWIGETPDDVVPDAANASESGRASAEPTLGAALLLGEYGLNADQVPNASDRLSVADVKAYIASQRLVPRRAQRAEDGAAESQGPAARHAPPPDVASTTEDLNVIERGMLRTVAWHRDEAVPGYVEIAYDAKAWEEFGAAFQKEHGLLLNPTLSLMAYRLVALRERNAKYNATIHEERKFLFQPVNVGFTVQSGGNLYLAVVAHAERMTAREFVARLFDLQKAAMKNRMEAAETSGATVSFTSMARWGVTRHQPVLPPHTSFMVAHSAPANGVSALGATYDHRLLTGADAVAALHFLKGPA